MKQLSKYINEKLVLSKDTFKKQYNYFPNIKEELIDIINQLLYERKDNDIIDLNDIDTSKITDMSYLFSAFNIKNIDISKWNVSKVIDMHCMFDGCTNLEYIGNISKWNVSNVEDMSCMFEECINLETIGDLSGWDVSSVKYMSYMFYCCENLKNIDISKWNVTKVNNMISMFDNSAITNIPSWYKKRNN